MTARRIEIAFKTTLISTNHEVSSHSTNQFLGPVSGMKMKSLLTHNVNLRYFRKKDKVGKRPEFYCLHL